MSICELYSFVEKFKNLWLSGKDAQLHATTRNGQTSVTLSLNLGYPSPPPQPCPSPPPLPSKNSPCRKRRRARRYAARTAAAAADTANFATEEVAAQVDVPDETCLLYTSPSPRDGLLSRMPSSA